MHLYWSAFIHNWYVLLPLTYYTSKQLKEINLYSKDFMFKTYKKVRLHSSFFSIVLMQKYHHIYIITAIIQRSKCNDIKSLKRAKKRTVLMCRINYQNFFDDNFFLKHKDIPQLFSERPHCTMMQRFRTRYYAISVLASLQVFIYSIKTLLDWLTLIFNIHYSTKKKLFRWRFHILVEGFSN